LKICLVEPFGGASGDMFLGALADAGADEKMLGESLSRLGIEGWKLKFGRAMRGAISASSATVEVSGEHPSRHLGDILAIIEDAKLPGKAGENATKVFRVMANAEAQVHDIEPEKVHFHEVGAVDSIIDVAGTCAAIELLGIEKLYCREIPLGGGEVVCAHGALPCPAPATLKLLAGLPVRYKPGGAEMTTPTGAALLATLCEFTQNIPSFTLGATGYGAGTREDSKRPNVLRVTLGEISEKKPAVWVVEANIDDMNPELYAQAQELLFNAGAVDVFVTPVQMKKSRPGVVLTALCPDGALPEVERTYLVNTTTFGVRRHRVERSELERRMETVETPYGEIQVKLGTLDGKVVTVAPEYESCVKASCKAGVPLKDIYATVQAKYKNLKEKER